MNTTVNEQTSKVNVPEVPKSHIYLALLFVPGVYIVLILSAAAVIAVGGGLIYLLVKMMGEMHRVNGRLVFFIIALGIGVLYGCYAVIKGVVQSFLRKPGFEPGLLINLRDEPEFAKFIGSICHPMKSLRPDCVILHAEPTAFVLQGKLKVFNGMAKGRVLTIGLPLLSGLTINELRAILAHEFAHFTGNDTLYSSVVLPVYVGASTAYEEMHNAIAANAAEEGSFFTRLPMFVPRFALYMYLTIFHLLDMRISRKMEQRADTIATSLCGTKSFSTGLRKVVGLSGVFGENAMPELMKSVEEGKKQENYFSEFRAAMPGYVEPAKAFINKAMDEPENPHDSHPGLKTRLGYIPSVPEQYEDNAYAMTLFTNLDAHEKTLTECFTGLLAMVQQHRAAMEEAMSGAGE